MFVFSVKCTVRVACVLGPGRLRAVLSALAAVTLSAVLLNSAPSIAASRRDRAVRSLSLGGVTCGCGRNLTQELVVKRVKPTFCTEVPYRGPRGVPNAEDKGYPLKLKVRRSSDRSRLFIAWNLKYIDRRKRARVTDFYLHFTKKSKRREQRSACFLVTRVAARRCRRKVSCVARYPKRRLRRVSVNLLYRFDDGQSARGGRKRRHQGRKYFRLKASVARKKRSARKRSGGSAIMGVPKIQSCEDWHPSINASCPGQGTLQVVFDPENPLADEIEVSLHRGINPEQEMTKHLPRGNTSCTFENLQSDEYSVTLRPRSRNCYGVLPFRSALVTVNGKPLTPICSDWAPRVLIREVQADPLRLEVSYDVPSNLQTDRIEVALEEDLRQVVALKVLNRGERNTTFNVPRNQNKTYQAMVRPLGCIDCMDYKMYRDPCELSYHTSNAIRIFGTPRAVAVPNAGFAVRGSITPFSKFRHDRYVQLEHHHDRGHEQHGGNDTAIQRYNNWFPNIDLSHVDHAQINNQHDKDGGHARPAPSSSVAVLSDRQCADCCRRCACGSLDM